VGCVSSQAASMLPHFCHSEMISTLLLPPPPLPLSFRHALGLACLVFHLFIPFLFGGEERWAVRQWRVVFFYPIPSPFPHFLLITLRRFYAPIFGTYCDFRVCSSISIYFGGVCSLADLLPRLLLAFLPHSSFDFRDVL
jgi:hypothetical protein